MPINKPRTHGELPTIEAGDLLSDKVRAEWVPLPSDPTRPYGPNGHAVQALIDRLPDISLVAMERCRFVAEQLGAGRSVGDLGRVFDQAGLAAAAERSGRRGELLAAFWDAGRACVHAWGTAASLDFFWNDARWGTMTEAAQYAAAATVVADVLADAVSRTILGPWQAATMDGWPAGMLGPNPGRASVFLDGLAKLSIEDARIIAAAWWPPEEDDPVWRIYDEPTARQVRLLHQATEASQAVDPRLAGRVVALVRLRLAEAAIEPDDYRERNTVLPKLQQATEAAALEMVLGDALDLETRRALRAGYAAWAQP